MEGTSTWRTGGEVPASLRSETENSHIQASSDESIKAQPFSDKLHGHSNMSGPSTTERRLLRIPSQRLWHILLIRHQMEQSWKRAFANVGLSRNARPGFFTVL